VQTNFGLAGDAWTDRKDSAMDILQGIQIVEAGRSLGHDFFHLSQSPRQHDWPLPVQEGFDAAASKNLRRRRADRFERKWLQLRLQAWQRNRAVADDVNVDLLRHLDVTHCPVSREALTHGERYGTDWSIDRLNNDGAYAASNLAVLSTRVNRAKGRLAFEDVLELSKRETATGGLAPIEWQRLATLMVGPAFATRHDLAPTLPLCAPLPACSVRLALQQIQRLFTLQATRPSGKNALVRAFRPACCDERSARMLAELGDRVHEGLKHVGEGGACWDVWLQPRVMRALVDWRHSLDERGWAIAARTSGRLAGGSRVTPTSLLPWRLSTRGYLNQDPAMPLVRRDQGHTCLRAA
jgi:hypothetical protein